VSGSLLRDCSTRQWALGLKRLRRICLESGLVETVKWGHPCYMHGGRNIVILGALRHDLRISFFSASLLKDPQRVLEKQGPNTQYADMIRFTDNARVVELETVIVSYIQEAMSYAEAGIKPPKEVLAELELPDELIEALECDPCTCRCIQPSYARQKEKLHHQPQLSQES
jgi:uncharacterized protein YdeI (YjbR/CyaY-like superfamily)